MPSYPHNVNKITTLSTLFVEKCARWKIIGKDGIKLTDNDPCPTGRRRRCFICLFYGTSEYATKEQTSKKFFSRKTKKGQRLKELV